MSSGKFNKIVFQFERKNMMKIPENIQYVPHMANQYNSYRIPFQKHHTPSSNRIVLEIC